MNASDGIAVEDGDGVQAAIIAARVHCSGSDFGTIFKGLAYGLFEGRYILCSIISYK